ncbi:MAG: hypothetical protein V3T22_07685 [Planctomycetota bacterium]
MQRWSRSQAIDRLREVLEAQCNGDRSICYVAARKGIFCRGFAQWKVHELKERYPQIEKNRPHLTRAEFEDLADRWQLARQFCLGTTLACDTQMKEERFKTCRGWNEFTNEDLAVFVEELCAETIEVLPDLA